MTNGKKTEDDFSIKLHEFNLMSNGTKNLMMIYFQTVKNQGRYL
jgi:hypothetical protein